MCGQTVWDFCQLRESHAQCVSWQLILPTFSAIFISTECFTAIMFKIKEQQLV